MSYEIGAIRPVHTQYGSRNTGVSVGVEYTDNSESILSVELTSAELGNGFVPPVVVPQGARIIYAHLTVSKPIATTAAGVVIGGAVPATNGVPITQAQLAAVGTYDLSAALTGTWATDSAVGTTADEKVNITAAKSTAPAAGGVATLSVKYIYKNRLHAYKAGTV